jgi:hypothetical protein
VWSEGRGVLSINYGVEEASLCNTLQSQSYPIFFS